MKRYKEKLSLLQDDRGVAAIFTTLILTVILSIIVLGFSQVANNELKAALSKQLSTQAFYAAESGINDAYSVITEDIANNTQPPSDPPVPIPTLWTCNDPSSVYTPASTPRTYILDNPSSTEYTCLLVDTTPDTLTYQPSNGQPVIAHIHTTPIAPNQITFTWDNANTGVSTDNNATCPLTNGAVGNPLTTSANPAKLFVPYAAWNPNCESALEVSIIPGSELGKGSLDSEAESISWQKTFYVYPYSSEDNGVGQRVSTYGLDATAGTPILNGAVYPATCASGSNNNCTFILDTNSVPLANTMDYYIKIQPIYNLQNEALSIQLQPAGTYFEGTQAQIDSTGQASNVLRRLRVAVNLDSESCGGSAFPCPPANAIQTNGTLCKSLIVGQDQSSGSDFAYEFVPGGGLAPADTLLVPGAGRHNVDTVTPPQPDDSCYPYN